MVNKDFHNSTYLLHRYARHTIQVNSPQSRKSTGHKVQNWHSQLVTENWLWRVDRYPSVADPGEAEGAAVPL